MLAASQREQELKFEVQVQIAGPEPTAVASFNYHQDHFSAASGSRWPTAASPTRHVSGSALERITMALLPHPRPRPRVAGRTRCAKLWGPAVSDCDVDGAGQPARPRSARRTSRTRCTRRRADLHGDQLLRGHPDRARPRRGATSRWRCWAARSAIDFEGDQWTFFKPPPEDLERLFGIDIHEMQPYRPLPRADRRADRRRPDDHRRARLVVSAGHGGDQLSQRARQDARSVAEAIDREAERLALLPQHQPPRARGRGLPRRLPPRARVLRPTSCPPTPSSCASTPGRALRGDELREAARELLARAPRPPSRDEPVRPLRRRSSSRDLPRLLAGDAADYHDYAFATVRMAGVSLRGRRRRTSTGCSGTTGREPRRRARADRRGLKVLSLAPARAGERSTRRR